MEITHANFLDYMRDFKRAEYEKGRLTSELYLAPREWQIAKDVVRAILEPDYTVDFKMPLYFMGITIREAIPLL